MTKTQKDIEEFQEIWSRRIEEIRNSELAADPSNTILDQWISDYKFLICGCTEELIDNNKYVFVYMIGDLGLALEKARHNYMKSKRLEKGRVLANLISSISNIFRRSQ